MKLNCIKNVIKEALEENRKQIMEELKEGEFFKKVKKEKPEFDFQIDLDEYNMEDGIQKVTYYFAKDGYLLDGDTVYLIIEEDKFYENFREITQDLIKYIVNIYNNRENNFEICDTTGNSYYAKDIKEYINLRYNLGKNEKIMFLK